MTILSIPLPTLRFGGLRMTIEEGYAHWINIIETQKTSGLSIAEY
jgi:hypothetical protein